MQVTTWKCPLNMSARPGNAKVEILGQKLALPATCMSRQASCISENFWDNDEAVELCKTVWTGWLHFLELSVGRDRASRQEEVWKPLDYISRNVQQQQVGRLRANPLRKQTLSGRFEIEVCHIEQRSLSSGKKKQPCHVNQHSAAKSLFLETDSACLGI